MSRGVYRCTFLKLDFFHVKAKDKGGVNYLAYK